MEAPAPIKVFDRGRGTFSPVRWRLTSAKSGKSRYPKGSPVLKPDHPGAQSALKRAGELACALRINASEVIPAPDVRMPIRRKRILRAQVRTRTGSTPPAENARQAATPLNDLGVI